MRLSFVCEDNISTVSCTKEFISQKIAHGVNICVVLDYFILRQTCGINGNMQMPLLDSVIDP